MDATPTHTYNPVLTNNLLEETVVVTITSPTGESTSAQTTITFIDQVNQLGFVPQGQP